MSGSDRKTSRIDQSTEPSALKALAHPLRQRVLGMLDERVASPKELAEALGRPLGTVSYHVRALAQLGCIELAATTPRRGALEHYYRAVRRPFFDDDAWGRLPVATRRAMFGENLARIFKDVRAAADRRGFDGPRTHVSRTPLELDDVGYCQVVDLLNRALDDVLEIQGDAAERLAPRADPGRRTEVVILHFDRC